MSPPSEHERHAQFLRHYAESEVALHTFVRQLVPTRQMAADVMQDVILVLWEKFDATADFHGWAFGVAKNVALRALRRQSRDLYVFDDDLVNQLADDAVALVPVHDGHREALERCYSENMLNKGFVWRLFYLANLLPFHVIPIIVFVQS